MQLAYIQPSMCIVGIATTFGNVMTVNTVIKIILYLNLQLLDMCM